MGTVSADDFEWGTKAALSGGTTMIVDFCIPGAGQSLVEAYHDWRHKSEKAACDYGYHMAVTTWSDEVSHEMGEIVNTYGINTFKHFMAYKGALMVDDEVLFRSFKRCAELGATALVHAENGDVVAQMQDMYIATGQDRPGVPCLFAPARGRGRGREPRHHDRRHGGLPALHRSHLLQPAHEAIARARAEGKRVFGEPLIQHLVLDESDYLNRTGITRPSG